MSKVLTQLPVGERVGIAFSGGLDTSVAVATVLRALLAGLLCWMLTAGVRPVIESTSGRGRRSKNCLAYVLTDST